MHKMHLSIVALNQRLFSGEVSKVMLPGVFGAFQVLMGHGAIVSSLIAGEVIYTKDHDVCALAIKSGFVLVADNQLTLVCDPQ